MTDTLLTHRVIAALGLISSAVLLWSTPLHAGVFDDDEARRQVAVERKRVDDLNGQQKALMDRLDKLEDAVKNNKPLLDLFGQIEALKQDIGNLRGQMEVLTNNLDTINKRQRDMYVDIDSRLRRFEQAGAPSAGQTSDPGPAASGAAAASANAAAAVAGADPAETGTYEAAQAQRKAGNFQGAITGFQNFIKRFPASRLSPRAQYWIGDSYFNLRDYKFAISNQQALIKRYPDSPTVPDAMLNIASAQIEMGDGAAGKKTLEELIARYSISEAGEKAKIRLANLNTAALAPASASNAGGAASPAAKK